MDTMDSIGTTFHPLIQHKWNFSTSLTNRKWTFPSESIRFQWIRWTPSERLSTPSSTSMSGIFQSLSRIENELFHRNLLHAQWIRRTPSERLSTLSSNTSGIFLRLSRKENELFHRNLFVSSDAMDSIGTTFHPSTNMSGIFLRLSRIENELFHRNLFVSNGSNTLGRTLHH